MRRIKEPDWGALAEDNPNLQELFRHGVLVETRMSWRNKRVHCMCAWTDEWRHGIPPEALAALDAHVREVMGPQ